MVSSLLARGALVTADATVAVLCGLDPELLAAPLDSPFAARPGAGEIEAGSLVVAVQDSPSLVRGLVHQVVTVMTHPSSTLFGREASGREASDFQVKCTLRRLVDDKEIKDEGGGPKWVPVGSLAMAGEPLGTPLHLACLFGCSGVVVSAVGKHNPRTFDMLDCFGRTPIAVAAAVIIISR